MTIRTRLTGAEGRTATFDGGENSKVDAVLWATGYRMDHSWIDVPGLRDDEGRIKQERGVTPVAGLYTVGLSWQLHSHVRIARMGDERRRFPRQPYRASSRLKHSYLEQRDGHGRKNSEAVRFI